MECVRVERVTAVFIRDSIFALTCSTNTDAAIFGVIIVDDHFRSLHSMTMTHVVVFVQRPRRNVHLELRNGVKKTVVVYAGTNLVAQEGCIKTLPPVNVYNGVINFYKS